MSPTPAHIANGIRFACTQCGRCCTGAPGTVRLNKAEISALSRRLNLSESEFIAVYARRVDEVWSIRERANGDCVFFDGVSCTVYEDRPAQCRLFPFWFRNLRSEESWLATCRECPGIGKGRLYSEDELFDLIGKDIDNHSSDD